MVDGTTILESRVPDLFPMKYDEEAEELVFAPMSRNRYKQILFLADDGGDHERFRMRFDDALLMSRENADFATPICLIMHPAYCGSTFLTRLLEQDERLLVLREPQVLAQAALVQGRRGEDLLRLSLAHVSRRFSTTERVVVKPHVPTNTLARRILDIHAGARIIYLRFPLTTYIRAVVKRPDRIMKLRFLLDKMKYRELAPRALESLVIANLNGEQVAACWWLWNKNIENDLVNGYPERVRAVDSEALVKDPLGVLTLINNHLGWEMEETELRQMAESEASRKHSKYPELQYDRDLDLTKEAHELELLEDRIDRLRKWLHMTGMADDTRSFL